MLPAAHALFLHRATGGRYERRDGETRLSNYASGETAILSVAVTARAWALVSYPWRRLFCRESSVLALED